VQKTVLHKYFVPALGIPVGVLMCVIWLQKHASAIQLLWILNKMQQAMARMPLKASILIKGV